jgi:predicted RNase H-like HicB family nuclease
MRIAQLRDQHRRAPDTTEHLNMLKIESEQGDDGRWTAEVPALPGVFVYAHTKAAANVRAKALALRAIADRLEKGEPLPRELGALFEAA